MIIRHQRMENVGGHIYVSRSRIACSPYGKTPDGVVVLEDAMKRHYTRHRIGNKYYFVRLGAIK